MPDNFGLWLTAGSMVVGSIVWLVRLEGRVNGHDREHRAHRDTHDDLRDDIKYIRARIDTVLNGRHK